MEQLEIAIAEIKETMPGLELRENEPMSEHCSFRIGGPARVLAIPSDVSSLSKICCLLKKHKLAPYIIGNGTNILFPDEGLNDLFIISTAKLGKLFIIGEDAIYAEAGVSLAKLAGFAQQNGLEGLEFASGIPGSVGGGVIMNAGAYDGELKDAVESVVFYYLPDQSLYEMPHDNCAEALPDEAVSEKPRRALPGGAAAAAVVCAGAERVLRRAVYRRRDCFLPLAGKTLSDGHSKGHIPGKDRLRLEPRAAGKG